MPVSDLFVPTVQPPDTPAIAGSLWFHVRASHVWVAEAAAVEGGDPVFLGMLGTTACWAVDVPPGAPDPDDGMYSDLRPLRPPPGGPVDRRRAGRAAGGLGAHPSVLRPLRHRRSGRSPGSMKCPRCGLCLPRLAPAVITLVSRGDEALLARG
jgi:hypothetical protein